MTALSNPKLSSGGRVPYIPQMEATECGAACLAMVLGFYGHHLPLMAAREACGVSRDGANALAVKRAGIHFGLESQGRRMEVQGLKTVTTPAILHWNLSHFVVLEAIRKKGLMLVDPAQGRHFAAWDEVEKAFSGIVLTFTPGPTFERTDAAKLGWRRYVPMLRGAWPSLVHVLGLALLLEVVGLIPPAGTQIMIDHVIRPHRDNWLWFVAIVLVVAFVVRAAMSYLRQRTIAIVTMLFDVTLMASFVSHLMTLPMRFFEQRSTGDLMARVRSLSEIRAVAAAAVGACLDGLLVIGYSLLMMAYNPTLGGILLGISGVRVAILALTRAKVREASTTELVAAGREGGAAVEAIAAPEAVKAFQAEELLCDKYENLLTARLNATLERRKISDRVDAFIRLLSGIGRAAILGVGGLYVISDQMTLGVFIGFITIQGLLDPPLEGLLAAAGQIIVVRAHVERLDDVLETAPEPVGALDPGIVAGHVAMDNVGFRYGPTGPLVVEQIQLRIRPGEKVAFVGRSGSGKSTVARLVAGALAPTAGHIAIDGLDLRDIDLAKYRPQLGVVLQEPFFWNDTIRANISASCPTLSLDRIREAAALACIDDVIEALPLGYDTPLGDRATRLSGGQRQRLAIARAIAHRPRLLLLDEATSALDAELEARVHANLKALRCTRIVVAHRLATVRDADRVYVMDRGKIVQEGTYDELSNQVGPFRQLVKAYS